VQRASPLPGISARAPLALVIAVIYLLGAVTGGSLLALIARSIKGAKAWPTGASGIRPPRQALLGRADEVICRSDGVVGLSAIAG